MPHPEHDTLTSELRDRLRYVEGQLEAERQAHAEARRIIAGLVERIPQLEAPRESPEAAETVKESPEGAEPHHAAEEARAQLVAERALRQMAEGTLHDGMSEERRRREEAERERDELRRELHARSRQQEVQETVDEQQVRGQPRPAAPGAQEGARRPWWRRIFGG